MRRMCSTRSIMVGVQPVAKDITDPCAPLEEVLVRWKRQLTDVLDATEHNRIPDAAESFSGIMELTEALSATDHLGFMRCMENNNSTEGLKHFERIMRSFENLEKRIMRYLGRDSGTGGTNP
jgi:hypothetical protein